MALFLNAQRDAIAGARARASRLLKQGIDALTAGDTHTARRRIEESLALAPGSLRAIFALAQVDLREAKTDAALSGFERVLALERGAPEKLPRELKAQALNNVGVIYFGRGQYEDSAHALEEARGAQRPRLPRLVQPRPGAAEAGARRPGPRGPAHRARARPPRRRDRHRSSAGPTSAPSAGWTPSPSSSRPPGCTPTPPPLWLEFAAAQRGLGNLDGMTSSLGKAIELDPANAQGAGFQAAMELAQSALTAKNFGQALAGFGGRGRACVRRTAAPGRSSVSRSRLRDGSRRRRRVSRRRSPSLPIAPTSRTTSAPSISRSGAIRRPRRRFPPGDRARSRRDRSAAALARLEAQRRQPRERA